MQEPLDRMKKIQEMLEKQPDDTFLLYGLALEHKKAGDRRQAIQSLQRVTSLDPNHAYAWYQTGVVHEAEGDLDAARAAFQSGVAAANRTGDAKALGELQTALDLIP